MDLSKAFDVLPHNLIVAKFNAYNFDKTATVLISSYLRNRQQRVKIGNARSKWLTIKKGVPQGSIVGPTIFNYFVNDLILLEDGFTLANYADDNTICASAPTKTLLLDKLSSATNTALRWFRENKMQANASKFQFIVFGSNTENLVLEIENTKIEESDNVKLLGVTLDKKLSYNVHVTNLCRKTAWHLAALARISRHLTEEARKTIFRSFV